jgi:hypothetical protein
MGVGTYATSVFSTKKIVSHRNNNKAKLTGVFKTFIIT